MLISPEATRKLIDEGKLLHIAGNEDLLKQLPKGNWIGGSTEYFMAKEGGRVSGDELFVTVFPYESFNICSYDAKEIPQIAADAFDSGFTITIVPFDSQVHIEYAQNAAGYDRMFMKHVVGWIAGVNLSKPGQTPIAVNGKTGETFDNKAVALHLQVPDDKTVSVNIINIFEQDPASPLIEFTEEGFSVSACLIDGVETNLADYVVKNKIDTKLPLVGDYSGNGVNVSYKSMENGVVNLYAPVFTGVKYRVAKNLSNYEASFHEHLAKHKDTEAVFSCNCILNFLYGELEGKKMTAFDGAITFGEIAYQLVNQTLVYVTVS